MLDEGDKPGINSSTLRRYSYYVYSYKNTFSVRLLSGPQASHCRKQRSESRREAKLSKFSPRSVLHIPVRRDPLEAKNETKHKEEK